MEINQAGLSWDTVLNKADSIKAAYANYDIAQVANFSVQTLKDCYKPGIIRMRKKIEAALQRTANPITPKRIRLFSPMDRCATPSKRRRLDKILQKKV